MLTDLDPIVGRDAEMARLGAFLDRPPAAIVLEGPAGIGKTTLWRWTVAAARGQGFQILAASPATAETALSFAALDDMLEPAIETVLPRLAGPRRAALRAALLMSGADEGPPDPHAIAAALRDAIRHLAQDGPVLVAIDDAQWIDQPSAAALAYALRRLGDARASVLVSRRPAGELPFALDRAFERFERLYVTELGLDALHQILVARLGLTLPRPLLRRIVTAAAGNPFFALETGRALQRRGALPGLGDPLPVPDELPRDRLAELPVHTRELLAAAAALSEPTPSLLEAVAGDGLRAAVDGGLLELDGERVRFTHPLLRSAALELLLPSERRALHRRLASAVADVEERARQLAHSVDGPDADVAASLEDAARAARRRGAIHAAAELSELALLVTPPADRQRAYERRLLTAGYMWDAGHGRRARTLGEDAVATAPNGPARADALTRLGRLLTYQEGVRTAVATQRRALELAGDDVGVRAAAHAEIAIGLFLLRESLPEAEEHARVAVELTEPLNSPARLVRCLANQGVVKLCLGRADAHEPIQRALALERSLGELGGLRRSGPEWDHAWYLQSDERLDEATVAWTALLQTATERGEEGSVPYTLAHLALTRCLAGALDEAAAFASEGQQLAVQAGLAGEHAMLIAVRALVDAYRGDAESCRTLAAEAIEAGEQRSLRTAVITARSALGVLAIALGEFARVVAELAALEAELTAAGVGDPTGLRFVPDYVEALAGLRELERARAVLTSFEAHAVRLDRPAARAAALRGHGLIAAAAGDADAALSRFAAALVQHERAQLPLEHARTLLAQGATLRRAKRKSAARAALEDARAIFDASGARIFAKAAEEELRRISGRAVSSGGLTPSELRVAELVAAGRTNRETAAALFVTERTVEGHLSRIYAKLGVRSRSQLARRLPAAD